MKLNLSRGLNLLVLLTIHLVALAQSNPAIDPGFAPVISRIGGHISAITAQADGKILIAGTFNAINGVARLGLARLNPDGSLDSSFDAGEAACCGSQGGVRGELPAPISAITVQPDGKTIIAGGFTRVRGVPKNGIARLNPDGSLDAAFDAGTGFGFAQARNLAPVSFILVQPDGRLLVAGNFTTVQGIARSGIARLNSNGSLDKSFDPGTGILVDTGDQLTQAMLLPTGKFLLAGTFSAYNEIPRFSFARVNPDGSLDPSFDPQVYQVDRDRGPQSISGFALQPDGRIMITGVFDSIDFSVFWNIGRLNSDGSVDKTFPGVLDVTGGEGFDILGSQGDGKVLGIRTFTDASGLHRNIARLTADGLIDSSFTPLALEQGEGGRLNVTGILKQADGRLVIAGRFNASGNVAHPGLVRLQGSGGQDPSWSTQLELSEGGAAQILTLAVQKDGKSLIGGSFSRVNGIRRDSLARLNRDGSLDTTFNATVGVDDSTGSISAIKIQDDGRILIGGTFRTVNGVDRNGLARLMEDGSVDNTFVVGTGTNEKALTGFDQIGRIATIAIDGNGSVLIAGDFLVYGGQKILYAARLSSTGKLDPGFNMGFSLCDVCDVPTIRGIAPLPDGTLLVGGRIDRIGVGLSPSLVRLQKDGNLYPVFDSQLAAGEEITSLAQAPDGSTLATVQTPTESGGYRGRLIKFLPDGTPDAAFKADLLLGSAAAAAPATTVALDSNGRAVFGGALAKVGDLERIGLARISSTGTLDGSFQLARGLGGGIFEAASTAGLSGIGFQDDGGIVVGGRFMMISGAVRFGVARLQSDAGTTSGGGRPQLLSPARSETGVFTFLVSGEAGRNYRIESTTDFTTWQSVGSVAGNPQGQLFRDSAPPSATYRFYRAVAVP